jgi:predicted permease
VVILGYNFALTLFGDAEAAMNRVLTLDGRARTVIGVMPPGFAFPSRSPVLWAPMLSFDRLGMMRTNLVLNVIARLRPGVSIEQARADMNLVAAELRQAYPNDNAGVSISVIDLHDLLLPQSRMLVVTVFGAAFCLLLIVCTNVANLLLARAVARRHEMAVRAAIGAGSWRLIRQLLTESALLAVIGGIAGAAIAVGAVPVVARLVPDVLPVATAPAVDGRILLCAALVTLFTSAAVGVVPALRPSRIADPQSLRSRAAPASSGRLRAALVVTEVAATATLLVAAGLLVKALWRVQSVDIGFHADGGLTLRTNLPTLDSGSKYRDALAREQFYAHVLAGTSALPGVVSAAYTTGLPLVLGAGVMMVTVPGIESNPATAPRASIRFVTPRYFATMGIPLRQGRFVDERDGATAAPAVTISESLAKVLWAGQNPIGRQITIFNSTRTVVGVAGDVVVRGLERTSEPQIYLSVWQPSPFSPFYAPRDLVVRAQVDARTLVPAIRAIIREADPDQPVADVRLFDDILALQTASRREQIVVIGLFAGLASLLAAVGMYGLPSYAVSARTQEVGVRVALGAGHGAIIRLFLQQGVGLGAAGIAIAMPLAYAGGRAIHALLFGVSPADPSVYIFAAGAAAIMTLTSSVIPAIRAATINPAISIRADA